MSVEDAVIGRNVAIYRGDRSQAEIATEMRAYGWKWAQNTVSAVEKGERPLRLAEAADLARILRVGFRGAEALAAYPLQAQVDRWIRACFELAKEMKNIMRELSNAQTQVAVGADELENVPGYLDASIESALQLTPLSIARELRSEVDAEAEAEEIATRRDYPNTPPAIRLEGRYVDMFRATEAAIRGEHPEAS